MGLSSLGRPSRMFCPRSIRFWKFCTFWRTGPGARLYGTMRSADSIEDIGCRRNTDALLGPAPAGRKVRIMVTMPSEAADDYHLVYNLLKQGMDCMRINCAHDNAADWLCMIKICVRRKVAGTVLPGRHGPGGTETAHRAARTGPSGGPDSSPAQCVRAGNRPNAGLVDVKDVSSAAHPRRRALAFWRRRRGCRSVYKGEHVAFTDARDSDRSLTIVEVTDHGCWAENEQNGIHHSRHDSAPCAWHRQIERT